MQNKVRCVGCWLGVWKLALTAVVCFISGFVTGVERPLPVDVTLNFVELGHSREPMDIRAFRDTPPMEVCAELKWVDEPKNLSCMCDVRYQRKP